MTDAQFFYLAYLGILMEQSRRVARILDDHCGPVICRLETAAQS